MRISTAMTELETRASEALQAILARVSGVRLNEIRREPAPPHRAFDLFAQVDVFGHRHTLACKVKVLTSPRQLRMALDHMHDGVAELDGNAIPILIAPCLSLEAQEICKHAHVGFLDLEGNARLVLGEVFIGVRSHPRRNVDRASAPHAGAHMIDQDNLRHFPAEDAEVALIA